MKRTKAQYALLLAACPFGANRENRVNSVLIRLPVFRLLPALVLPALLMLPGCSSDGGEGDGSSISSDDDVANDPAGTSSDDDVQGDDVQGDDMSVAIPVPTSAMVTDEVLIEGEDVPNSDSVFGVLTEECEGITEYPEQLRAPVDIIFVIDNSGSMAGEIEQVQDRINDDLTGILASVEVDYRVIMISRYGDVNTEVGDSDHPICIRAPLGAGDCSNPEAQALVQNPPRFFHYSADVRSREPWCDILEGFDTADELKNENDDQRPWTPIAPIGWRQFLREEAFKHFVVISDDDVECSRNGYSFDDRNGVTAGQNAAVAFDTALLALSPRQFGSNDNRNYNWHSIIGLAEYSVPLEPWPPTEPIQTDTCGGGSDGAGTGFQALSILTGGLRYPSCNNENFDAVFRALAETVVHGSLACEWQIPDVPDFSVDAVNVRWITGDGSADVIVNVGGEEDCEEFGGGWYFNDNEDPETVIACPQTCQVLQSDPDGRVDLLFGCDIVTTVGMDAR